MIKVTRQPMAGGIWFHIGGCNIGTMRMTFLSPPKRYGFRTWHTMDSLGWKVEAQVHIGHEGRIFELRLGGPYYEQIIDDWVYLTLFGIRDFIAHKKWVWKGRAAINEN